jgi:hypothetical protein
MIKRTILLSASALAMALSLLAAGYALAGGSPRDLNSASAIAPGDPRAVQAFLVDTGFWYQGLLTDQNGTPIENAQVDVGFRLYDVEASGTPLAAITITVDTDEHGLFNEQIDFGSQSLFDGTRLWLGVRVTGEDEMVPRHQIRPVPYALSLRPGAIISRTSEASALTLVNNGFGPALSLQGSGRVRSSAPSFLHIPAATGWKWGSVTEQMTVFPNRAGTVKLTRDAPGESHFAIPVALPGFLYGQTVTIEEITIRYMCDGDMCDAGTTNTNISSTALSRAYGADDHWDIVWTNTDYYSSDPRAAYTLQPDYSVGAGSDWGTLSVSFFLEFGDTNDAIWLQGLVVKIQHY